MRYHMRRERVKTYELGREEMRWLQTLQESNPDMVYARSDERGYALLEITPGQARCQFRATAQAQREDASLRVQATYAVERGRAGVQRG